MLRHVLTALALTPLVRALTAPMRRLQSDPEERSEPPSPLERRQQYQGAVINMNGSPLTTACWTVDLVIQGSKFAVLLDSGSTNLLIPGSTIDGGYTGAKYDATGAISQSYTKGGFMDGSGWSGVVVSDVVQIGSLVAQTEFIAVTNQTSNPSLFTGSTSQGLLGIAYDSLSSSPAQPPSFLTSLVQLGAIPRDLVALRGCPANSKTQSVIDFGATDHAQLACGVTSEADIAWAAVGRESYFTVDVTDIAINGASTGTVQAARAAGTWQKAGGTGDSIFDTCTTLFLVPKEIFDKLGAAIYASGAMQAAGIPNSAVTAVINGYGLYDVDFPIDYTKLPTMTFSFTGAVPGTTVSMTFGGRQYIQSDGKGHLFFIARPATSMNVMFGAVIFDRKRVGLAPGCDCGRPENTVSVTTTSTLKLAQFSELSTLNITSDGTHVAQPNAAWICLIMLFALTSIL
ncbi:aspartic peptidase domain-containing protein [Zopfochytrium polystomum]|nr:aspartic peptidase domain-containing protein [Zopfochytrium polystomum]